MKPLAIVAMTIAITSAFSACSRKAERTKEGKEASAFLSWYLEMSKVEDAAYEVYFAGNPERAEEALDHLVQYLDSLPDRRECQVARYTDRTYALARIQFIRAYRAQAHMDFSEAVDSFARSRRLSASPDIDRAHFAYGLVQMVRDIDGPRVSWANSQLKNEADAAIDRNGATLRDPNAKIALPNQAAEPTRTTVTPAANAPIAPAGARGSP